MCRFRSCGTGDSLFLNKTFDSASPWHCFEAKRGGGLNPWPSYKPQSLNCSYQPFPRILPCFNFSIQYSRDSRYMLDSGQDNGQIHYPFQCLLDNSAINDWHKYISTCKECTPTKASDTQWFLNEHLSNLRRAESGNSSSMGPLKVYLMQWCLRR